MDSIHFNNLPMEVLFVIFKLLTLPTLIRLKNVCRFWYETVGQVLHSYKEVMIQDFEKQRLHDRCGTFTLVGLGNHPNILVVSLLEFGTYVHRKRHLFLTKIIEQFRSLKVLYLCLLNGPLRQFNLLDVVTEHCPSSGLRHLSIITRRKVFLGTEELKKFCDKFRDLKVFQFEAIQLDICAKGIEVVFKNLPKLEIFVVMDSIHSYERQVQIFDCPNLQGLEAKNGSKLFCHINKNIRVIKVPGNLMDAQAIKEIPECHMRHLNNLHICDFDGILSVELIGEKFQSLNSLTLSNSYQLKCVREGEALMSSIAKLSQLKKLHLFIETKVSIFSYESFSRLKTCSQLTSLQIESTSLTGECIEAISRFMPQITKLDLTYVYLGNDSSRSIAWLSKLQRLQCLKLSASAELEDVSTVNIIDSCHRLQYLDFSRSDLLSVQTFKACLRLALRSSHCVIVYFSALSRFAIESVIANEFDNQIPVNLKLRFPTVRYI